MTPEIKERKPRKSRAKVKVVSQQTMPLPELAAQWEPVADAFSEEIKRSEDERILALISSEIQREKQVIYGKR